MPCLRCSWNQWYLTAICFERGVILGNCALAIVKAPLLSSQTVHTFETSSRRNDKEAANSAINLQIGIRSRIPVDSSIYLASVVLNKISVCNLDDQRTGVPPRVRMNPVRLQTDTGSVASSQLYNPAKSASAYMSNAKSSDGLIIISLIFCSFQVARDALQCLFMRLPRTMGKSCTLMDSKHNIRS